MIFYGALILELNPQQDHKLIESVSFIWCLIDKLIKMHYLCCFSILKF